ncbi:MAG TPA: hypothetical protein DCF33_22275 [Saprospirales bacterium]|nr:hypothetical protein [Saprospirales bacterium]
MYLHYSYSFGKNQLLVTCFSFVCSCLFGQAITFKLTYSTPGDDEARYAHVLPDNSILLAGSTTMGNHGNMDALLLKLDEHGVLLWSATYGGASDDFFKFILPCSDGNFIAYGETRSFGGGGIDLYLVKFDPNGNLIWSNTYGGTKDELASGGLCETPDGYLISGATQSFGAGFYDIYLIKTNFSGQSVWTRRWGTGGGDGGGEPILNANGEVWVPGGCFYGTNNHNGIMLRVSPNGTLMESNQFGGSTNEGNECFTPGGAGMTASSHTWVPTQDGLHQQPWMLSYSIDGSLIWSKRYPIEDGNYRINAESCPDGGFIFSPNRNGEDIEVAYLIKTDTDGEVDWSYAYYYEGTGDMYHAVPCPDGGYLAVGYRSGAGKDIFLLKTNANGLVLNCRPISADIRSKIYVPNTQSLFFSTYSAGLSAQQNSQSEALALTPEVICASGATGVSEQNQSINLFSISPNPAYASILNMIYELPETDRISIALMDVQGRNIGMLLNESRAAGNHEETVTLPAGLTTGMYFVNLRTSRSNSFVKLMLVQQ